MCGARHHTHTGLLPCPPKDRLRRQRTGRGDSERASTRSTPPRPPDHQTWIRRSHEPPSPPPSPREARPTGQRRAQAVSTTWLIILRSICLRSDSQPAERTVTLLWSTSDRMPSFASDSQASGGPQYTAIPQPAFAGPGATRNGHVVAAVLGWPLWTGSGASRLLSY